MMSNAPTIIAGEQLQACMTQADIFFQAGIFPDIKSKAQAVAKVLAGRELGLQPFESMQSLHIIQGKVAFAAGFISAKIKASGRYDYQIVQLDDNGCELRFFDKGRALTPTSKFLRADAEAAGLFGREMYKKYPRNMYFSRALTNGARWHCADVFGGAVYTPDELGNNNTPPEHVTAEVVIEPEPPTPSEPITLLENPWLHKIEAQCAQQGKALCELPNAWFNKAVTPTGKSRLTAADAAHVAEAIRVPELRDEALEQLLEDKAKAYNAQHTYSTTEDESDGGYATPPVAA